MPPRPKSSRRRGALRPCPFQDANVGNWPPNFARHSQAIGRRSSPWGSAHPNLSPTTPPRNCPSPTERGTTRELPRRPFRAGHFIPVQVVPIAHVSGLTNFVGVRGCRNHFVSHVQGASQKDEPRQSQRGRSCAARGSEAYLHKSLPSLRPRQNPPQGQAFRRFPSANVRFIAPPTKDRATPRLQRTIARRSSIPR